MQESAEQNTNVIRRKVLLVTRVTSNTFLLITFVYISGPYIYVVIMKK